MIALKDFACVCLFFLPCIWLPDTSILSCGTCCTTAKRNMCPLDFLFLIDCLVIHMLLDVLMPNFCGLWLLVLLNVQIFWFYFVLAFPCCVAFVSILIHQCTLLMVMCGQKCGRFTGLSYDDLAPCPTFTDWSIYSDFLNFKIPEPWRFATEYESPVACHSRNLPHKCCADDCNRMWW